ncbi:MAG: serine/threonine protein kinase [Planctomycetes bacterium]|nr:serine/threonine protein kinase [Planctomycetota bacterium]
MDESSSRDLELLLLAVQQGVLSNKQVEECLRDWEERHGKVPGAAPAPLQSVAVSKGYISEQRLSELALKRRSEPDLTALRVDVVMVCRECREPRTLSLQAALQKPRCSQCSGILRFQKQAGSTTVQSYRGPLPEEVRNAMEDPKSRFAKYVLISKLGTGGMGEVWKAWDTVLHRPVALKFPRTTGEEEIRRLYLEAQGAGSLNHPNVAGIYEIAEAEGRHYIAMQYIKGKTADDMVKEPKPPLREIVRWVRDAALGVHYAHECGVIHRDIKPANIMIDVEGRVYVMDFGLAKLAGGEGSATVSGAILGTPAFMPPEQAAANAGQVDRRSDVYALGATLYVLVSGRRPFEGESATDILVQILTTEPPTLRQAAPDAPWELEAVLARAMARPREGRYPTAKDLAADLDRFLANEPVEARKQTPTHRFVKKVRQKAGVIAAAAAFLVLAAAAGFFYVRSTRLPPPPPEGRDRFKEWSLLFPRLQTALSAETFDAAAAGPLLARMERDFPEQKKGIDQFVDREFNDVQRMLADLPRSAWLESAERIRRYRDWLAFSKKPTGTADRMLAYRGTLTLTAQVSPYAELRGPMVDALPPEERLTPFMRKDLEIVEGGLELFHPQLGSHPLVLPPLRHGAALTIEGSLKDPKSIKISEGP